MSDTDTDLDFRVNPIVTTVRPPDGGEMAPSRLWAHHRICVTLGLEFLFVPGFHLALPSSPDSYPTAGEKELRTRAVGDGMFPQHEHVDVRRWTFSRICLGEAYHRSPEENHRAWNRLGLSSRVRTEDALGGVISVRGYDGEGRVSVEVLIPPSLVWHH
eukprot:jgi/Tetstr1/464089/TSEL_008894.t1